MNIKSLIKTTVLIVPLLFLGTTISGCNSLNIIQDKPAQVCAATLGTDLKSAIVVARQSISNGCEQRFHGYLDQLLTIAEGDPGPDNQQHLSEFLIWASDRGIVNRRQAQHLYNRYFNVKFVSLMGDYNNCSQTCPSRSRIMTEMEQELVDKERGLIKISADTEGYYRADQLLKETRLVLEATCSACETQR